MASTVVAVDLRDTVNPVLAILDITLTGSTTPDVDGYILTVSPTISHRYTFIVPEACIGVYRITLFDGDGLAVAVGYVYIAADDTNTYIADDSHTAVATYQLLGSDQIMESSGAIYKLSNYSRGTVIKIIPDKTAKKIGGANLADPLNELWSGYQE